MSLILDASMALAWVFEDEGDERSERILDQTAGEGAFAPALWRLEVANGLRSAIRRQRITPSYRDGALATLRALPIEIDPETDLHAWRETLAFSDRLGITPYDAAYLELAARMGLPLASGDAALTAAALRIGAAVIT